MIRTNSFQTALAVASAYAANGQTLAAAPNTLLSELLVKSVPTPSMLSNASYEGMTTIDSYGWLMSILTEDTAEKPSDHSMVNGAAVSQIAPLVAAHLRFAKNTVKPLVLELATCIERRSQELKAVNPSAGVEIIMKSLPAVLTDESFLDTLRHFRDRTPVEPKNYLSIGDKTKEEIVGLMMTGHQRTDNLIAEWISKLPEGFARKVWCSYFNVSSDKEEIYDTGSIGRMNVFDRIDFALGVYLLARKVYDDVQDEKMSLEKYRNISLEIRDYAGDLIALSLKFVYGMIESKILIIESSIPNKTITVNGELYGQWITTGGKPEILLGMLTAGQIATSIPMIDEKAEVHLRNWNAYTMFQTTDNNNRFYDRLRQAVLIEFNQQLVAQEPDECVINERNTNRLVDLSQKAADYIDNLKNADFFDFHFVALHLVAGVRFGYTSSFQILNDIGEACKANPGVDVREAALLAAINYLGDFLASQIMVVK